MFLLSSKILGRKTGAKSLGISFFLSIFYSLNLYTAIVFHTPVSHVLYLFGVTPLLVLLFIEIEASSGFRRNLMWLVIYVLLYWPLTRMMNMFVIYLVLVPLIGFIVNYGIRIPFKRFFKYCATVSIMVCLVSSPVLFMLPFGKTMPISISYSKSAVEVALGNKILDSIRFIPIYAWKYSSQEIIAGVLSYSFLVNYQSNPFLIVITFYPILLVSFLFLFSHPKLQRQGKSRIFGLLLIAVLNLALTTPSLTPLGELLYQNKIYILRSAWKYFSIPYILCLSITLILLLKQLISKLQKRKFTILLVSLLLIQSTYILPAIWIYGKPVNQAWIVKIPHEYHDLTEFLQKDHGDYRILPLPITKHFAGYVPFKWGYVGPDILYTLTDKPIIDKHHNVIAPQEYLDLMNQTENATPDELIELCKILNVKYILLRGDVETNHPYIKVNHPPNYYKEFLDQSQSIKTKYVFGNLTLYELNNYMPRIFLQPINTLLNSKNLLEVFNETAYKPENITYLWFNETPIIIKNHENNQEDVQNFTLNITFRLLQKNTTDKDWQTINHAPIQTELFKIAVLPEGWLYVFLYFKNGTYRSIVTPFQGMKRTSSLEINIQNNILSVYLDKAKVHASSINSTELVNKISTIKIGSNFGNTEMLIGKIYDLNFTINNEEEITTQTLFSNYPEYIKQEEIFKLNLNLVTTEWKKLSPTNYIVKINNTTQTQNGYFLTFLTTYDPNWKAYLTQNGSTTQIPEEHHIKTFNYANTWYINQTGQLEITIEYEPQKWFYYGSIISVTTLLACLTYLTYNWTKNKSIWKQTKKILARIRSTLPVNRRKKNIQRTKA